MQLAQQIKSHPQAAAPWNRYHVECVRSVQEAALWAALTGLELLAQRESLQHGDWLRWIEANCTYCRRTATNYMQAAERAVEAIGEFGQVPSSSPEAMEIIRLQLTDLLENDQLAEDRAALIASIRPAKQRQIVAPAPAPKPARPPRPSGPRPFTLKAAPVIVSRLRIAPQEVRVALFTELRPEIEAWLSSQPLAAA